MVYTQKSFIFFHIHFRYIWSKKKNCGIPLAAPGQRKHQNIIEARIVATILFSQISGNLKSLLLGRSSADKVKHVGPKITPGNFKKVRLAKWYHEIAIIEGKEDGHWFFHERHAIDLSGAVNNRYSAGIFKTKNAPMLI